MVEIQKKRMVEHEKLLIAPTICIIRERPKSSRLLYHLQQEELSSSTLISVVTLVIIE